MDGQEAMETDPDDVKEDLRTELFVSLQYLKRLEYVGVTEIDRFLRSTFELPAQSCHKPRFQNYGNLLLACRQ